MGSIDIDDIAGISELSAVLEVSKQVLSNWRVRYTGFPPPIKNLAAGPIYSIEAVKVWHKRVMNERVEITKLSEELALRRTALRKAKEEAKA